MVKVLVISCSLNRHSRSALLAREAVDVLKREGAGQELIDLRDQMLPLCDGAEAYQAPAVQSLREAISGADAVLLTVPVYNYSANAAAKNLIELTGRAWTDKVVGFLCSAGGKGSYMSMMSLASSLMLDFRCLIVPRFVYTTDDGFDGDTVTKPVVQRIEELVAQALRLAEAMKQAGPLPAAGSLRGTLG
jgi:FMN reductase